MRTVNGDLKLKKSIYFGQGGGSSLKYNNSIQEYSFNIDGKPVLEIGKTGITSTSGGGNWTIQGADIYNNNLLGNVGIGLTNPAYALDVNGDIDFTGSLFQNGATIDFSGTSKWTTQGLNIYNNNLLNGNVGIGLTTPAYDLDVDGDINFSGALLQNGVTFSAGGTGTSNWTTQGGNLYNNNLNGNVGIGLTTPAYDLDVSGIIQTKGNLLDSTMTTATSRPALTTDTIGDYEIRGLITGGFGTDGGFMRLSAGGNNSTSSQSYIDICGFNANADMDDTIVFGTRGVERMRIDTNGLVTVDALTVDGDVNIFSASATPLTIETTNTSQNRIEMQNNTGSGTDRWLIVATKYDSGTTGRLGFAHHSAVSGEFWDCLNLNRTGTATGNVTLGDNDDICDLIVNGYIGIETNNPSYELDVVGDINFTGTLFDNGVTVDFSGDSKWTEQGADIYNDNLAGDVGIGLTNPAYKLDVGGDINFTGSLFQNGTTITNGLWTESGSDIYYNNILGDVGIGLTNPAHKLEVVDYRINSIVASFIGNTGGAGGRIAIGDSTERMHLGYRNFSSLPIAESEAAQLIMNSVGDLMFSTRTTTESNMIFYTCAVTSPVEAMRIQGVNGNVGIGLTNPAYKLDVEGDINFTGTLFDNGVTVDFSGDSKWTANGGAIYNDNLAGNVGIGLTTPAYELDVSGIIQTKGNLLNSDITTATPRPLLTTNNIGDYEIRGLITGGFGTDGGFMRLSAGGNNSTNSQTFIDICGFNTNPEMDDTIVFGTAGGKRMRINISGYIGIGTDNPVYDLDVNGDINFSGTLFDNGVTVDLSGTSKWTSNGGAIYNDNLGGNVGIGVTNPAYKLDVEGDINFTGTLFQNGVTFSSGGTGTSNWTTQGGAIYNNNLGGNVGIGITNPEYMLDVNGTVRVGITTSTSVPLRVNTTNLTQNGMYFENPTGIGGDIWHLLCHKYDSGTTGSFRIHHYDSLNADFWNGFLLTRTGISNGNLTLGVGPLSDPLHDRCDLLVWGGVTIESNLNVNSDSLLPLNIETTNTSSNGIRFVGNSGDNADSWTTLYSKVDSGATSVMSIYHNAPAHGGNWNAFHLNRRFSSEGDLTLGVDGGDVCDLYVFGDVGIGTDNPSYGLDVVGSGVGSIVASFMGSGVGQGGRIAIGDTIERMYLGYSSIYTQPFNNNFAAQIIANDDLIISTKTNTESDMIFYACAATSAVESMRIKGSNGFIGIGLTNPAYTLDVSGDTNLTGDLTVNGNVGIGTPANSSFKLDITDGGIHLHSPVGTMLDLESSNLTSSNILFTNTSGTANDTWSFYFDKSDSGITGSFEIRHFTNFMGDTWFGLHLNRTGLTTGNLTLGTTSGSDNCDLVVNGDIYLDTLYVSEILNVDSNDSIPLDIVTTSSFSNGIRFRNDSGSNWDMWTTSYFKSDNGTTGNMEIVHFSPESSTIWNCFNMSRTGITQGNLTLGATGTDNCDLIVHGGVTVADNLNRTANSLIIDTVPFYSVRKFTRLVLDTLGTSHTQTYNNVVTGTIYRFVISSSYISTGGFSRIQATLNNVSPSSQVDTIQVGGGTFSNGDYMTFPTFELEGLITTASAEIVFAWTNGTVDGFTDLVITQYELA